MKNLNTLNHFRLNHDEIDFFGCKGDEGNGLFKVRIKDRYFYCIASNGGGWEHVSVSPEKKNNTPSWKEMCMIKDLFFEADETVVQYHPAKSDYVNLHPTCLHLWRPINGEMICPPKSFV